MRSVGDVSKPASASPPRLRVEHSVVLRRPPEHVWRVVAEPANDPLWCRKVKAVERLGPRRWRVVHKPVPLRPAAELRVELVTAEAPRCLRLRGEDDASVFDVEYTLEPTAEGTRLTQISEFAWKTLPVVVQRMLALGVSRDVRGQLRDLKRLLEGS